MPHKKGIGYPSCTRELDIIPPNTADPHGYYRELNVSPGASEQEIRETCRRLFHRHHPDTGDGDVERFQRIKLISEVLLDPIKRDKYNRTPKGMRLMDEVYASELSRLDVEEVERLISPATHRTRNANPYVTKGNHAGRYDYFAKGHLNDPWQTDELKAQLWYHHLIELAPIVNYRRVIKVMIHDGDPEYHHDINMMVIPRTWEPSSALALSLYTTVAQFRPGHDDPTTRQSVGRRV